MEAGSLKFEIPGLDRDYLIAKRRYGDHGGDGKDL